MTNEPYTEYKLTHWEEPDNAMRVVSKDGYVSMTPEALNRMVQSFFPVGYREGEITVDLEVSALKRFWLSLGGEMERS